MQSPGIIIPVQHQSAPKTPFPKNFQWNIQHIPTMLETDAGIQVRGQTVVLMGARNNIALTASFPVFPWDEYDRYRHNLQFAIDGIMHDINVVLDGGDPRTDQNTMLDKVAEKASTVIDASPEEISAILQMTPDQLKPQ
jgi:hypothetical protein